MFLIERTLLLKALFVVKSDFEGKDTNSLFSLLNKQDNTVSYCHMWRTLPPFSLSTMFWGFCFLEITLFIQLFRKFMLGFLFLPQK